MSWPTHLEVCNLLLELFYPIFTHRLHPGCF
jgi:hypothetical protein